MLKWSEEVLVQTQTEITIVKKNAFPSNQEIYKDICKAKDYMFKIHDGTLPGQYLEKMIVPDYIVPLEFRNSFLADEFTIADITTISNNRVYYTPRSFVVCKYKPTIFDPLLDQNDGLSNEEDFDLVVDQNDGLSSEDEVDQPSSDEDEEVNIDDITPFDENNTTPLNDLEIRGTRVENNSSILDEMKLAIEETLPIIEVKLNVVNGLVQLNIEFIDELTREINRTELFYNQYDSNTTCDKCGIYISDIGDDSWYTCIDHIGCLEKCCVDLCIGCKEKMDELESVLEELIGDPYIIVRDYFEPISSIHTYRSVTSDSGKILVNSSYISEWIQFLSTDDVIWIINCNTESKFYGFVYYVDYQNGSRNGNQMLCHISDFINNFQSYVMK